MRDLATEVTASALGVAVSRLLIGGCSSIGTVPLLLMMFAGALLGLGLTQPKR